ncbi:MAG TPA: nuclear transport factor 2 family protein [Vicinamibacterales bacterium]
MSSSALSTQKATVVRYYEQSDAGRFPADLFTEDFEFYVPKFGVGRGIKEFETMASGVSMKQFRHAIGEMLIVEDGRNVAVEGTSEGVTGTGVEWRGGRTPGGRFASLFRFNAAGLIERMYIYLDPDFAGDHAAGFRWNRGAAQAW